MTNWIKAEDTYLLQANDNLASELGPILSASLLPIVAKWSLKASAITELSVTSRSSISSCLIKEHLGFLLQISFFVRQSLQRLLQASLS